ncbi:hypothetical protein [Ferrimicrobium acidiphilum]|nr:hypothetical protein [Ferrimicrobium acidiphilum]MDA8400168.1 hypothetical protein [Actinomycetota bacterium]
MGSASLAIERMFSIIREIKRRLGTETEILVVGSNERTLGEH